MEFLILFGALFVGVLLGWELRERYAMRVVNQLLKEVEESTEAEAEETDRIKLERHGEVVYAFDGEDNFIAQGATVYELDEAIQKRFPGRKFLIKESNMKEVGFANDAV